MDDKVKKAISLAIEKEDLAYKHYLALSKDAQSYNLRNLFTTMAIQELRHEALLKDFMMTGDFLESKEKIQERYDSNFKITDNFSPTMELTNIKKEIAKAMAREKDSYAFYDELMQKSRDDNLKDLFFFLVQEERMHERLLRKEYNKL